MKRFILPIFLLLISQPIFAQNAIRLDTISIKKYALKFDNGVVLDFGYEFIYPTNTTPVISKIRDLMIRDFFENDSTLTMSKAVERYEKKVIAEYTCELPNTTPQYHQKYSAVNIVNDKVLVLMMQFYVFYGGNHGFEPCDLQNYDLKTGDKITIDDLFSEASKSKVLELIKQKITEKITVPLSSDVWLTDNFMLLPKGIKFSFNPYQISSYGDGRIDAIIKYSEFKYLLKPEAVRYFITE